MIQFISSLNSQFKYSQFNLLLQFGNNQAIVMLLYRQKKYQGIQERLGHNDNSVTITWEYFRLNVEPLQAYQAIKNYLLYCCSLLLELLFILQRLTDIIFIINTKNQYVNQCNPQFNDSVNWKRVDICLMKIQQLLDQIFLIIFLKKQHFLQQLAYCLTQQYYDYCASECETDYSTSCTRFLYGTKCFITRIGIQNNLLRDELILSKIFFQSQNHATQRLCNKKWDALWESIMNNIQKIDSFYIWCASCVNGNQYRCITCSFGYFLNRWKTCINFCTNKPYFVMFIRQSPQWITLTDDIIIQIFVRPTQINQFTVVIPIHVQNVLGFKLMSLMKLILVIVEIQQYEYSVCPDFKPYPNLSFKTIAANFQDYLYLSQNYCFIDLHFYTLINQMVKKQITAIKILLIGLLMLWMQFFMQRMFRSNNGNQFNLNSLTFEYIYLFRYYPMFYNLTQYVNKDAYFVHL